MAGHGRPPVDEPRIKKITFRVTDDEFDQIELYAKESPLDRQLRTYIKPDICICITLSETAEVIKLVS